jgi:superfamily II DNA/RNA helicase
MDTLPEFLPFRQPMLVDFLIDAANAKLRLKVVHTDSAIKAETLMKLVASFGSDLCLVFCNHREAVDRISALFAYHDLEHGMLHGAMEQIDREKNLIKFRGGAFTVLIATDLAARGLDIPEIRHVVHYQLPHHEDSFIHRNGRTARMHADGQAYLVLADDEVLPDYIDRDAEALRIAEDVPLPPPPAYACLYISAGRKDKVNKGDIAGLLMKKGGVSAGDVGLITTLDHVSFVSVKRPLVKKVLANLKDERIKKLKVKIAIAN